MPSNLVTVGYLALGDLVSLFAESLLEMGVLHFWCSIRKLIFLSKVMWIALNGILTRPML
jgi:hypothetical protein